MPANLRPRSEKINSLTPPGGMGAGFFRFVGSVSCCDTGFSAGDLALGLFSFKDIQLDAQNYRQAQLVRPRLCTQRCELAFRCMLYVRILVSFRQISRTSGGPWYTKPLYN